MSDGSQSSKTDKSPSRSESGWVRISSNEGFEKIRSIKLDAVVEACCQNPDENICRNWDTAVSIARKCGPEVEMCEMSNLRRLKGGEERFIWIRDGSDDRRSKLSAFHNRFAASKSLSLTFF